MSRRCQQGISRALKQEDTFTENPEDFDVWPMWITCVMRFSNAHRRSHDGWGTEIQLRMCSMLNQACIRGDPNIWLMFGSFEKSFGVIMRLPWDVYLQCFVVKLVRRLNENHVWVTTRFWFLKCRERLFISHLPAKGSA